MRKCTALQKIVIDHQTNFAVYVKEKNAIPEFMAYSEIKKIFSDLGYVFVPNCALFENNVSGYLFIEEVQYKGQPAKKWFECISADDHYLEGLAQNLVRLLLLINKSASVSRNISIDTEINDIFRAYPTKVNAARYLDGCSHVLGLIQRNLSDGYPENMHLVQRDLYNNLLIGIPWSHRGCAKTTAPISVIDFGEAYKYSSVHEIAAELIVIWENKCVLCEEKKLYFLSCFIRELRESTLWDLNQLKLFSALWQLRIYIWQGGDINISDCIYERIIKVLSGKYDY